MKWIVFWSLMLAGQWALAAHVPDGLGRVTAEAGQRGAGES